MKSTKAKVLSTEQRVEKLIRENGLARQTAIMNELKGTVQRLSSLEQGGDVAMKARQTLMNRNSCLPDLNAIQNGPVQSEQEILVDLISSEVSNYKKDILDNYVKIAEKTEKELQNVDNERTQLLAINQRLTTEVKTLRDQLRTAYTNLEHVELNLNHYMTEFDVQTEQLTRVRENYEKYEKLHANIERQLKSQLAKLTEESESKINELSESNKKLSAEKAQLVKERTQNASQQLTSEEFQKYQADQIAELTLKNSKLSLENEDVRTKNMRLVQENSNNLDKINNLQDEIHRITNEYEAKIDQITKTYELRLKAQPQRSNSDAQQPQGRFSDLYSLQIPEMDTFEAQNYDAAYHERERTVTELDRLNLMRGDSSGPLDPSRKTSNLPNIRPPGQTSLSRPTAMSNLRKPTNLSISPDNKPKESSLIAPPVKNPTPPALHETNFGKREDPHPKLEPVVEEEIYDLGRETSGPNFLVISSETPRRQRRRNRKTQHQNHTTSKRPLEIRRSKEQRAHPAS